MNLLIVDDDKLFIRKTIEGIDWDSIGIYRVFSAENMEQAINVLKTFSIDIIVTDVEMPLGSGLELLEWIFSNKYAAETLVISGYAHFAYAQKAIEYGSKRYLLKPISCKELTTALNEVVCEMKRGSKSSNRNFIKTWKEMLNAPKTNDFLSQLNEKEILSLNDNYMCEIRISIQSVKEKDETESKLLMYIVQNVILELFEESNFVLENICLEAADKWSLLVSKKGKHDYPISVISKIQNYLKETAHLESCAYISHSVNVVDMLNVHQKFSQFCSRTVFLEQAIVFQSEWEQATDNDVDELDFSELSKMLIKGQADEVSDELKKYIESLVNEKVATVDRFHSLADDIIQMVRTSLKSIDLNTEQEMENEWLLVNYENVESSVTGMNTFINSITEKLKGTENVGSKKKQIVKIIKQYISDHIDEELTRKNLADSIYFSEDYVARIFKSETGKNISDYVMEQRIELAKEYLSKSDISVGMVAMKVGYNNFSYFSKKFKELTGKSPNEYRFSKKTVY